MAHNINDHLTPELEALLLDKSKEAKETKIAKIIAHINEVESGQTQDPEMIYAAGIGYYFLGEYEKCMEKEEEALPYFDDEMGIAAIFWHTLASWRSKKRASLFEDCYHSAMLVGHHKSYNRIMALEKGVLSEDNAKLMFSTEFRPLELSIFGYGLGCWLEKEGKIKEAQEIFNKVYSNDDFWISYAYLACWCDKNRR